MLTEVGEIVLIIDFIPSEVDNSKINIVHSKRFRSRIPQNQQALIFEAFKQQDGQKVQENTESLDFLITKRLVDVMRLTGSGKHSGKGSTFSVICNIDIAAVSEEVAERTQKIDYKFKGSTILLVEDIASNREVVKESHLEKTTFECYHS